MWSSSSSAVLQQVNQLWSMLDEMSDTDPAAYRSFMDKQRREGAEFREQPRLHCCLVADVLAPQKGSLYVNICSWKRVPAPEDPSRPSPVFPGKLETHTDDSRGSYSVLDVALNPTVLQDGKLDVCSLALSFAQQQQPGLRLSQRYTKVNEGPMSRQEDLNRRLGYGQRPDTPRPPVFTAAQTPANLLQQISSLRTEEQLGDQTRVQPPRTKNLIQVISTTPAPQPRTPEHRLEVKTAGASRSVELTVELPEVRSVSECQLRISQDDVLLEVEDVYRLLLEFPQNVNDDSATATFNKKERRLTVTVDLL